MTHARAITSRADRHLRHRVTPAGARLAAFTARIAALVALCAGPVHAQLEPANPAEGTVSVAGVGTVRLAAPAEQARLDQGADWTAFRARHGEWSALWNTRTGSPHRAFGKAIPLPGFVDRADAVEAAVRTFIASHSELFGSPTLETIRVQRVRETWYLSFRQTLRGLPVLFGDWEFRVGTRGGLFAFGADVQRVGDDAITLAPALPAAVARQAATIGVRFDPARDVIEGGTGTVLLPVETEQGTTFRAVTEVRVITSDPPADWRTLVDAATGEVVLRTNRVRYAISGTVTGTIHAVLPTDPVVTQPLKNLTVNVGPTPAVTNGSGGYSVPAGGAVTVSAQLSGPYCNVNRQDGVPDASFSTPASDPATVNIAWNAGNSHDAERDGFYHVNLVHDYVRTLDPGSVNLDYQAACNVNVSGSCNAFYSPGNGSVNFYIAGGSCPNMATMPDVVYHEYGHGVNEHIYYLAGQPSGMFNGALHEGMADVLAAMIQDNSSMGKGFFGPGTVLRQLDNTRRWPQDGSGDGHITGLIIGGAFWDLRQAAGLAVAAQLSHFAKYGVPDDPNDGVAMEEFFIETLIADDDDADLSNGTPHANEIASSFNLHGIGTVRFMSITHTPLGDQPGAGGYPVTAVVAYDGPFGALAGAPSLHYAYNNSPFSAAAMTPTGNPNEYTATIPHSNASVVSYYIEASDTFGQVSTHPEQAPVSAVHRFIAGQTSTILSLNMETEPGWVVGAPGDAATTGIWLRTDPNGTQVIAGVYVQPEDDHTVAGIQCFVTGNAMVGAAPGTNDVDGGATTLTSATIDATFGLLADPIISYYRWYSNNQGSTPGTDFWRVYLSNDGGANWVVIENTSQSDASWRRVLFRISDYIAPTNDMRIKFVAEDAGAGSLVEAAVDDFMVVGFQSVVGVGDSPAPGRLALTLGSAHPAAGPLRLSYTLPSAGEVSLRIYDLAGREVRTLATGRGEAGTRTLEWDGRSDGGLTLASGTYFARLVHEGAAVNRTVVWAH